jgi:hypothetical protein
MPTIATASAAMYSHTCCLVNLPQPARIRTHARTHNRYVVGARVDTSSGSGSACAGSGGGCCAATGAAASRHVYSANLTRENLV